MLLKQIMSDLYQYNFNAVQVGVYLYEIPEYIPALEKHVSFKKGVLNCYLGIY